MERDENERKLALSYSERLRIWESDYGVKSGWTIELRGGTIAMLTEPNSVEMFWVSYRVTPLTPDQELRRQLQTDAFWDDFKDLVWRSREFGIAALYPFPAIHALSEPDRVSMRGLYINIGDPRPWDQVVLWLRRVRRKTRE